VNCREVQTSLSLYLYGELDFAREETVESHLAQCAACQLSLAREKEWHTLTNAQVHEPPLDLLAECRQQLRPALARESAAQARTVRGWWRWGNPFDISFTRWSGKVALASLLVFIGFAAARWLDRGLLPGPLTLNPSNAVIRDIQTDRSGLVRIVFEQERAVTGQIQDADVRSLLLSGLHQADAGVRFYSVQLLNRETDAGRMAEVRQALLDTVRNDPNPAVRLEAVDGLGRFSADPAALETLKFVLEHDENPGVRYRAIDALAPPDRALTITPVVTRTIQDVLLSSPDNDYVHARCSQILEQAKLPVVY
jgi:hypothetical protein